MEKSFEWIKSAITSSLSEFHIECCKVLLSLFTEKYKAETGFYKYYGELLDELIDKETFLN